MRFTIILFLFISCVTADRDEQKVNLTRNMARVSSVNYEEYINLPFEDYEISILNIEPDGNFFKTILSNFIVDDEKSALTHLSATHMIAMITITNKTGNTIQVPEKSLYYAQSKKELIPLRKLADYPTSIGCINWKGNIKNLYNTAVITGVTVFIVGAFVACAKEGKCDALRQTDNVAKVATSGETKPDKTFSNPIFESKLKYADIIELDKPIILAPNEVKQGMVLYPKPLDWKDTNRALLTPNCLVY